MPAASGAARFLLTTATAIALALALMPAKAPATMLPLPAITPAASCEAAGANAERDWHIPPGLLAAIGRMESGRFDAAGGRVIAWPWTIDAEGQGASFDSREAAIAAVQALQMRGVQSIDVGCFQINLLYHPDAFGSLEEAFDPAANAAYAARFLNDLHMRGGSWEMAVAWYHSATPGLGEPYRDRVLADWAGGGVRVASALALRGFGGGSTRGGSYFARGAGDPHMLMIVASAAATTGFGIHVWTPGIARAVALAPTTWPPTPSTPRASAPGSSPSRATPASTSSASTSSASTSSGSASSGSASSGSASSGSAFRAPVTLPRVITPRG